MIDIHVLSFSVPVGVPSCLFSSMFFFSRRFAFVGKLLQSFSVLPFVS